MADMKCVALRWEGNDYVGCGCSAKLYRLCGLIVLEVPLCELHRDTVEADMRSFGGCLDDVRRVTVIP